MPFISLLVYILTILLYSLNPNLSFPRTTYIIDIEYITSTPLASISETLTLELIVNISSIFGDSS